jgi:hypothetical protein
MKLRLSESGRNKIDVAAGKSIARQEVLIGETIGTASVDAEYA